MVKTAFTIKLLILQILTSLQLLGQGDINIDLNDADRIKTELKGAFNIITDSSIQASEKESKRKDFVKLFAPNSTLHNDLVYMSTENEGSKTLDPELYSMGLMEITCCLVSYEFLRFEQIKGVFINANAIVIYRKKLFDRITSNNIHEVNIAIFLIREDDTSEVKISGITELQYGDSDGDGFIEFDKRDDCPNSYGEINGCPDNDQDGIINKDDDCPEKAGLPAFKGCPDTDGDGISDNNDACPEVPGLPSLKGCPEINPGVETPTPPPPVPEPSIPLRTVTTQEPAPYRLKDDVTQLCFELEWEKLIAISQTGELFLYSIKDESFEFEARRDFEMVDSVYMVDKDVIMFRTVPRKKEKGEWKEAKQKKYRFTKARVPFKAKESTAEPINYRFSYFEPQKKEGLIVTDTVSKLSHVFLTERSIDLSKVKINQTGNCLVAIDNKKIHIWQKYKDSNKWIDVNLKMKEEEMQEIAGRVSVIEVSYDGNMVFLGTEKGEILMYVIS